MPSNIADYRFNRIEITVIPNPQYQQVRISDGDLLSRRADLNIQPSQLAKLEIFKSYETSDTRIRMHVIDLDNDTAAAIAEGKIIIHIMIDPMVSQQSGNAQFGNFFLCTKMNPPPVASKVAGTYPLLITVFDLKSITLQRMQIENNFAFTLGGKGPQFDPLGAGIKPLNFLEGELGKALTENYSPESVVGSGSTLMLDLDYTKHGIDSDCVVNSTPSTGYQMDVNTNWEVLDYFFDQYPVFVTPYVWLLDDFSTKNDGKLEKRGSVIKLLDLTKYQAWKPFTNKSLSDFIMGKTIENIEQRMESFKSVDFKIIDRKVFYNTGRFMFRDNSPKIYAEEMATGNPINLNTWNAVRKHNYVLTNTNGYIKVKKMPNPMYKYFVTFMTPVELQNMVEFNNIFMNLHPDMVTYNFNNLWFGQIDIHTVIDIEASHFNKYETYDRPDGKKYDRIGVGYQVLHVFEKVKPNDAIINFLRSKSQTTEVETVEPAFTLSTEITFLMIDKGPNDIISYTSTDRGRPYVDQEGTTQDIKNNMAIICGDEGNPAHAVDIDIAGIPKVGPSSAANTQIAVAAAELIKKGFSYADSDCSNFVMKAVRAAGADVGKIGRFPDGTLYQWSWFAKNADNGIEEVDSVANIKPGDIAFFRSQGRINGHVVIAYDNTKFMHSTTVGGKGAAIRSWAGYGLGNPTKIFRILPSKPKDSK
jgi:cell wall-associated NlpC family hydrolase